jgi:N-acetylmuramoyl-L-alanine amidase
MAWALARNLLASANLNFGGRPMIRAVLTLTLALFLSLPALAQDFRAVARVDATESHLIDQGDGVELLLALTQAVPYRVFTLQGPDRVVIDFREVAWGDLAAAIDNSAAIVSVATGGAGAGWSRMVLTLAAPMAVVEAGMETEAGDGSALVRLRLDPVDQATFVSNAGAPAAVGLPPEPVLAAPAPASDRDLIMVALDPGHGGVDPGALRNGTDEADLMLVFALELREVLLRTGRFDVVLTREGDWFVSLPERVTIARGAGADVFLSLHADALTEGGARGATVYTLSDTASDAASAALAEAHDRADLLAGVDLAGNDDEVAGVLIDLARLETAPRSGALADQLVAGLTAAGATLYNQPRLEAGFSVLKAADIPSVLLELGYLSDSGDLENLQSIDWRARVHEGIRDAMLNWALEDAAISALLRR